MIELNIGSVHIRIGREKKDNKINFLRPKHPSNTTLGVADEMLEIMNKELGLDTESQDRLFFEEPEKNAHPSLKHARVLAGQHGWREIWHRKEESRVRFKKGKDDVIDIWYEKMTVGTVITHPTKGRKALFRKNVTNPLLGQIFKNPRVHTGEGYYER